MDETLKLAPDRILESIKQSCLRRTAVDGTVAGNPPAQFSSAFLHTDRESDSGRRHLLLVEPSHVSIPHPGTPIEMRYEYDRESLVAYSLFVGRRSHELNGLALDAWELEFPEDVFRIQRRAFFRVRADTTNPVKLSVVLPGEAQDVRDETGKQVSSRLDRPLEREAAAPGEVSGVLSDLSGGGMSFCLVPEPPFVIQIGATISIQFTLPAISEELSLEARIVAHKRDLDGRLLYCVEFTNTDRTMELRRSHNCVMQYIAQRERATLKSLRMSHRWP